MDVVDATKVRPFGPGLEPKNCRAGIPVSFKVDTTKAGKAPLKVQITSDKGTMLVKFIKNSRLLCQRF